MAHVDETIIKGDIMQKINIANSFGVNILGVHIPKNAIYGKIAFKSGKSLTYYITDLEDLECACELITAHVCMNASEFHLGSIPKSSRLGRMICNYALNNVPYGTRVIYPYKRCLSVVPKQKLPQTATGYLQRPSSQSQIDGRSRTGKYTPDTMGIPRYNYNYEFYDDGAYNGWSSYR